MTQAVNNPLMQRCLFVVEEEQSTYTRTPFARIRTFRLCVRYAFMPSV